MGKQETVLSVVYRDKRLFPVACLTPGKKKE